MNDRDAEMEQPDRERGEPVRTLGRAPRRAVVAEQLPGQSVAAKQGDQVRLHGGALFVGTGGEPEQKAGVVVEHGQGMAAAPLKREVAGEVKLPQIVGGRGFEAGLRLAQLALCRIDQPVPVQDRRDGAGGRGDRSAQVEQTAAQLAPAPGRMLRPQRKHRRFHRGIGPVRRPVRQRCWSVTPALPCAAKRSSRLITGFGPT